MADNPNYKKAANFVDSLRVHSPSKFDQSMAAVVAGLFGTLSAITERNERHEVSVSGTDFILHLVGVAFDFTQLLAFPLSRLLGWEKFNSTVWLSNIFSNARNPFVFAERISTALGPITFAIVELSCFCFIGVLLTTMWSFSTGRFRSVRPLRILKATADFVVILQITFVERLGSIYLCGDKFPGRWSTTDVICDGVFHTMLILFTSALLFFFICFSLIVRVIRFESDYSSEVLEKRAHGRVEFIMVTLRCVLTLVFSVASIIHDNIILSVVLVAAIIYPYVYIRYLPELAPWRNKMHGCLSAAFSFSAFAAIFMKFADADSSGESLGLMYFMGLPGAILFGYLLVSSRLAAAGAEPGGPSAMPMHQPCDVELVARSQINMAASKVMVLAKKRANFGSSAAVRPANGVAAGRHGFAEALRATAAIISGARAVGESIRPTNHLENELAADLALRRAILVMQKGGRILFPESSLLDFMHINLIRSYPRTVEIVDYTPFLAGVYSDRRAYVDAMELQNHNKSSADLFDLDDDGVSDEEALRMFFKGEDANSTDWTAPDVRRPTSSDIILTLVNAGLTKPLFLDVRFLLILARTRVLAEIDEDRRKLRASESNSKRVRKLGTGERMTTIRRVQLIQLQSTIAAATLRAQCAEILVWGQMASGNAYATALHPALNDLSASVDEAKSGLLYLTALAPAASVTLLARGIFASDIMRDVSEGSAAITESMLAIQEEEDERLAGLSAHQQDDTLESSLSDVVNRAMARRDEMLAADDQGASAQLKLATIPDALKRRALYDRLEGTWLPSPGVALAGATLPKDAATAAATAAEASMANDAWLSLNERGKGREPFFAALRFALRSVFVVTVLVHTAAVVIVVFGALQMSTSSSQILVSSDRSVFVSHISNRVEQAQLMASGLLTPIESAGLTFNASIIGLYQDAITLTTMHKELWSAATASGGFFTALGGLAGEKEIYTDESIPIESMLTSNGSFASIDVNFVGLGAGILSFVSKARSLSTHAASRDPFTTLSRGTGMVDAYFITQNARGAMRVALNTATDLTGRRIAAHGHNTFITFVYATLCAIIVPILLFFVTVGPRALRAQWIIEGSLAALAALPLSASTTQRGLVAERLNLLQVTLGQGDAFLATLKDLKLDYKPLSALLLLGDEQVATVNASIRGTNRVRCRVICRFLFPVVLLICLISISSLYAFVSLDNVRKSVGLVHVFAAVRGLLPLAPDTARRSIVAGLAPGTTPHFARGLAAACNQGALNSAYTDVQHHVDSVLIALQYAMEGPSSVSTWPGSAWWPAPDPKASLARLSETQNSRLLSLMQTDVCMFLKTWEKDGLLTDALGGSTFSLSLGMPNIDCLGTSNGMGGTVSTGAMQGLGGNGLPGAIWSLTEISRDLVGGRIALLKSGKNESVIDHKGRLIQAPALDTRNASWPCAPPVLQYPSLAWRVFAGRYQLIDPAVRAAIRASIKILKTQTEEFTFYMVLVAIIFGLSAIAAYWYAKSALSELDLRAKTARRLLLMIPSEYLVNELVMEGIARDS